MCQVPTRHEGYGADQDNMVPVLRLGSALFRASSEAGKGESFKAASKSCFPCTNESHSNTWYLEKRAVLLGDKAEEERQMLEEQVEKKKKGLGRR